MAATPVWLGNPAVRRYLMFISYDGSRFSEMATGGKGFGVVDMLRQAIADSLFGARPYMHPLRNALRISPSSRTDAGVHALRNALICQVPTEYATLDSSIENKLKHISKWNSAIEEFSPGGMKVLDLNRVAAGFCIRRHVAYRLLSEHVMGSFFKHTARDKRKETYSRSARRNILVCQISRGEPISIPNDIYDYYNITIVARSFVREQIRRMMSCIVFHGYDRLPLETIRWLLKNPISTNFYDLRIRIAPPQGLFLTDVVYPPEMFTNPFPCYRHAWDRPQEVLEEKEDELLLDDDC
ncbi:unnamed protein product [Haemonchus placei]|uniref:tRNA pseudouridine synthase n=1 Tax=Haemonchus placei TaxID=6290 RepID=A0A158QJM3_HAEPC|nr:unnamed protein product [Haemonchus placei]